MPNNPSLQTPESLEEVWALLDQLNELTDNLFRAVAVVKEKIQNEGRQGDEQ